MTPWIDTEKIRVGPIDPEERKAIDAQLARLLAQHRVAAGEKPRRGQRRPFVFGAATQPKRKGKCSAEHAQRLREYNRRRSEAIRARKLEEAANVAGKIKVRFLEAYAAPAVAQERMAAADTAYITCTLAHG
jgi:hypothetical protein